MTPEHHKTPDWARQERQADLAWINENLDIFRIAGAAALEDTGRGAIVVDTTSLPVRGAGHPFGYFSQEQIEEHGDEDTKRMVAEYDPTQEVVLVLLKSEDRSSTYRVAAPTTEPQDPEVDGNPSRHTGEPTQEKPLEPPNVETLIAWEAEGGCEAACPHHCWVEPDGVCSHGSPSWLRKLGLI